MQSLNYQQAGVDYGPLDAFKRACQHQAATTIAQLTHHGMSEVAGARGDSAYLLETAHEYLAHVEEGLGTKNLVADAMLTLTGQSHYHNIGIDTVATIVNDLVTCGALPISVAMHAAVGDAAWFENKQRAADLAKGFAQGCREAQAVWGGGETPALRGIVEPGTIVLAGSALGRISPKTNRITGIVEPGDAIIFLASSGVHTNGLTLCRKIAEHLPQGYLTPVPDDAQARNYGQALLSPSVIYVKFVAACQQAGLPLHYAAHVTGHGWRKLMRLPKPLVHRITAVRPAPALFAFLMQHGPVELREAYATFNMGVGFAVWVKSADADRCVQLAISQGYDAWLAGHVEAQGSRQAVVIDPLKLTYESDTLQLR